MSASRSQLEEILRTLNELTSKVEDILNPPKESKEEIVKRKKIDFKKTLIPYLEKYGKEMINAFYEHYCQRNENGVRLLWEIKKEKEGTWDIGGRLATWARNSKMYNGKLTKQEEVAVYKAPKKFEEK